eukprot:3591605-Karenia_brevis.AAC.1
MLGERLARWPPTYQLFGQLAKSAGSMVSQTTEHAAKRPHCFKRCVKGGWKCEVCFYRPRTLRLEGHCIGHPLSIDAVTRRPQGHILLSGRT